MMWEEWRPVVGYEGVYSISNIGRVRRDLASRGSRAGYILKQSIMSSNGYYRVGLVFRGKQVTRTVHSLIAEAFLGPSLGRCVNHKDGLKTHNDWRNLEYVTLAENNLHAHAIGLHPPLVTHCLHGHPYDEANTIVHKNGERDCLTCARRRKREYKARKRKQIEAMLRG